MKTIFLFLVFISTSIYAQVTQEWVATYSGVGVGYNYPKKCLIDKQNNIIVAGRSENLSFNNDFIVLKYNPSGNLLWERRYNGVGNGNDAIAAAAIDDSNNIYVTGYSQEGASLGGYNWVTIKYFPNGDSAWKRHLNWIANDTDEPLAMAIDKIGNICISGYGRIEQPLNDNILTLKYSPNGELIWISEYNSPIPGPDMPYSIAIDSSNNVISTGYTASSTGNELITIKYYPNGDSMWIRKYQTLNGDYLRPAHVTCDKDNNILTNGYFYMGNHYAFNTIKYNSSGDLLWNRIYKGDGYLNFCFALTTDDSSNVYAAGRSTNTGTGADFVTIKYYPNGDTAWINNYDGGYGQFDEVSSMSVDNKFNVYVTGRSDSIDGTSSYLTIKYSLDGILKWHIKFGRANYADASTCMGRDNSANLFVSGYKQIDINTSAIATIKYSNLTGLQYNNYIQQSNFHINNFPNPFNSQTKINYEIPSNGLVIIKIYDSRGVVIDNLVNQDKLSGYYSYIFNPKNYSSGIYFISLTLNNEILTTSRMLIIK